MQALRFIVLLLFILHFNAEAQPFFQRNDSILVKTGGSYLANPWAGGLNFIQVSNIDLNHDGVKDLFVFDRSGNKVRTFIHIGTSNSVDYKHAPEFEKKFPDLHDWALLADYNCDGKEDIFTYSSGGFAIYKNTSDSANGLQFTLVTPLQYSCYNPPGSQLINLYVSATDIPSITDIDNDGDLDVVTFAITGTYIEYHQNQSMELYGNCDSLKFEMKNRCWGYASENAMNNSFTLYDTCFGNVVNPGLATNTNDNERSAERHSGSCVLCLDLNGDQDKELVTGDISFNNLTMLTNGGTPTASSMVAVDVTFPSNNASTSAVDLAIFPCGYYVDINNDLVKDLLVSPNAPNVSENFNSVVYYKNNGTTSFPDFDFQQSNFLQDNMIEVGEGAYPVFFDYNSDGLKDLFVGNYGYYASNGYKHKIALYKNIGTATAPEYQLLTRDYAGLSSLGVTNMVPAFGDLDGDNDSDMILGGYDGKLHYFRNNGLPGDTADFSLVQANFKNANNKPIDAGDFAVPQIVDVDNDGKNDLIIGGRNGKVTYYHRSGSSTAPVPVMDSVTNFWGGIKVNAYGYVTGYSYPFLFKQNGVTKLLVGTEKGFLRMYDNIDGNLTGTFTMTDSAYLGIHEGIRCAPNGADINNDGYMDLVLGNYAGGLTFYKGQSTLIMDIAFNGFRELNGIHVFPNPADRSITIQLKNPENRKYQLELYSVVGQVLITGQLNGSGYLLNTESLAPGIYICKVYEAGNARNKIKNGFVKRIIIQH